MSENVNPKNSKTESEKILDRVAQDTEGVGTSSMKRVAGHFSAKDADAEKWSEVWGTRIGRSLGLIAFIVLIIHLVRTYVL